MYIGATSKSDKRKRGRHLFTQLINTNISFTFHVILAASFNLTAASGGLRCTRNLCDFVKRRFAALGQNSVICTLNNTQHGTFCYSDEWWHKVTSGWSKYSSLEILGYVQFLAESKPIHSTAAVRLLAMPLVAAMLKEMPSASIPRMILCRTSHRIYIYVFVPIIGSSNNVRPDWTVAKWRLMKIDKVWLAGWWTNRWDDINDDRCTEPKAILQAVIIEYPLHLRHKILLHSIMKSIVFSCERLTYTEQNHLWTKSLANFHLMTLDREGF